jgi:hypothetical protein
MSLSIIRDTVEYVEADIYSRTTLVGTTPTIGITYPGTAATWLAAAYTTTPTTVVLTVDVLPFRKGETVYKGTARTTSAVTFSSANYANNEYKIRAKLTDTPETPIMDAYILKIKD